MKVTFVLTGLLIASAVQLFAQGPPPGGPPPHRGGMGFGAMGMGMGHKIVTNAPYSADVTNSTVQTLADGNSIARTTSGHVARDSQGRTYLQETNSGGPFAQKGDGVVTFISDPVAGYSYVLNASTKLAMRRALRMPTGNPESRAARGDRFGAPNDANRVETDLGQQSLNGVNVTGKSVTRTLPAGAIGNAQPLVEKSEVWTSPDLQVVVSSKHSDPRIGTSTYALTNIRRGDPSATLFQVPSDYTLQDAPDHHHGPEAK